MTRRLEGKIAIVVGAGQTPGATIGNGRATAILFAREGAHVIAVDRRIDSAQETVSLIEREGGRPASVQDRLHRKPAGRPRAGAIGPPKSPPRCVTTGVAVRRHVASSG